MPAFARQARVAGLSHVEAKYLAQAERQLRLLLVCGRMLVASITQVHEKAVQRAGMATVQPQTRWVVLGNKVSAAAPGAPAQAGTYRPRSCRQNHI